MLLVICLGIYFFPKEEESTAVLQEKIQETKETVVTNEEKQEPYQNDDIVGSLSIEGLIDDEVLVQGDDNEYYLTHNVKKEEFIGGSLFVDYRIDLDNTKKIIIYGHSSKDIDIPFSILEQYVNTYFLKEHPNIELTINEEVSLYQVFSIMVLKEDYFYTRLSFSDESYLEHLNEIKEKSLYPIDYEASLEDEILILQTCSQSVEGEYIVVAAVKLGKESL